MPLVPFKSVAKHPLLHQSPLGDNFGSLDPTFLHTLLNPHRFSSRDDRLVYRSATYLQEEEGQGSDEEE